LFRGTVDSYSGNFTAYCRQKQERLLVQRRAFQKQQIEIDKAKEFIRRNAYGQKHLQAEDRKKKLERMELVEPPREINPPPMGFPPADRSGDVVLRVERLAKSYDRPLFGGVTLDILRGQRWAILGPNGSGKTTLVNCLLGQVPPDSGRAVLGHGVKIGYFDQQLKALDDGDRVVDAVRPARIDFDEPKRRDLLARFGITGDVALQPVASLSGGERCRAALARLAAAEANVLVLDEPTNHLDLWALEALQDALRSFDGTVLFVSHDRHFINEVADHLIVFEPRGVRVIEGNYSTYQHLLSRGLAGGSSEREREKPAKPTERREQTAADAAADTKPRRKRRFPYRKVEDLEQEIFQRESRLEDLHGALADPDTHRDGDRVRQIKSDITEEQAALKTLYEHWEEAVELNW
jgi:ATP-binding cassette subfamily F protein 3